MSEKEWQVSEADRDNRIYRERACTCHPARRSDIVERLRNSPEWAHCRHSMREAAADEIARLRADKADLLAALRALIDRLEYSRGPEYPAVLRQARNALAQVSK